MVHVTHVEWENELMLLIFQSGWYRGIIMEISPRENRICSPGLFLFSGSKNRKTQRASRQYTAVARPRARVAISIPSRS